MHEFTVAGLEILLQLNPGALQLFVGVERSLSGVQGCRQLQLQLTSELITACVRRLRLFERLLIRFDFDLEQTFVESEARNTFGEFWNLLFSLSFVSSKDLES